MDTLNEIEVYGIGDGVRIRMSMGRSNQDERMFCECERKMRVLRSMKSNHDHHNKNSSQPPERRQSCLEIWARQSTKRW